MRHRTCETAVFVLDLDDAHDTIRAVQSVLSTTEPSVMVLILVNGGGQDEADKIAASLLPDDRVRVVVTPRNKGFAGGNNYLFHALDDLGIEPEFLLLLNNDVTVDAGAIAALRATLEEDKSLGAVSPRVLLAEKDNIIADDGPASWYYWLMQHRPMNRGRSTLDVPANMSRVVPFVTGACMMTPIRLFKKMEGFDPIFFAYFEDWDYCLRLKKEGYSCAIVPSAQVRHKEGATLGHYSRAHQFLMTRNRYLIARKHLSPAPFIFVFMPYLLLSRIVLKSLLLLGGGHGGGIVGIATACAWLIAPQSVKPRLWPMKNCEMPDGNPTNNHRVQ